MPQPSNKSGAALSFAYKHWDVKNPFAKIDPPLHKEPQIRYLLIRTTVRYTHAGYEQTRQTAEALGQALD